VRLLELIEQDHGERLLAHAVDERVGGDRRLGAAEDLGGGLGRLELAHVEADQPLDGAEQEFAEHLGKLGLAGCQSNPQNRNYADRLARIVI
jgi:hypothetical protein